MDLGTANAHPSWGGWVEALRGQGRHLFSSESQRGLEDPSSCLSPGFVYNDVVGVLGDRYVFGAELQLSQRNIPTAYQALSSWSSSYSTLSQILSCACPEPRIATCAGLSSKSASLSPIPFPKGPCRYMVYTWALKSFLYPYFGV